MVGFSQFYLINCAAVQKGFVFELQLTRNKHSQGRAQKLQNNSLPFYCDANVAQCTKSLLLLQLHRVTYLVNFHSKQSQKSTSRFIPPLHFLEEMWIAITVLSQKKKIWLLLYSLSRNHYECILSVYSLYNINRVGRQLFEGCGHPQLFEVAWSLPHESPRTAPATCVLADQASMKPRLSEIESSG